VQFKHGNVRIAMEGIGPAVFEGYVGTSPSGFPAEVELAKQAARRPLRRKVGRRPCRQRYWRR
jgi:hypothetical protein